MEGEAELITHSHTAARKSQNQRRWIVAVVTQLIGQHPACFFAIVEHHTSASLDLAGCGKTLTQDRRARLAGSFISSDERSGRLIGVTLI